MPRDLHEFGNRFQKNITEKGPFLIFFSYLVCFDEMMSARPDDWKAFAFEMWGIRLTAWKPLLERAGKLPEPLEYDVLQLGLVELNQAQRHVILQGLSCYQASFYFLTV